MFKNAAGKVFYGMHFYPGVAEYAEENGEAFRVLINEATIRSMNPTFPGCPVYVEHVDEVPEDRNDVRGEADGYVVDSFFNTADGKTWTKFLVITDAGERAIRNGFKLSNAYVPELGGKGGLWNGVAYQREVVSGVFDHLAITKNPRYGESIILTPDQFKAYNEEHRIELARLSNSHTEKEENSFMGLKIFKRAKVENSADFESMSVTLPKSGKDFTLTELVNDLDARIVADAAPRKPVIVNADDIVAVGEDKMTVAKVIALLGELAEKLKALEEGDDSESDPAVDGSDIDASMPDPIENEEDTVENEDDDAEEKAKAAKKDKMKNAADVLKAKKANFDKLKNARQSAPTEEVKIMLSSDRVAKGKDLFGSN